jgi:ferredoxin
MAGVGILYFSGTGNTWYIADQYARAFGERGREVELLPVEKVARGDGAKALEQYELLGIGYPVHAWNAPRLVAGLLQRLPRSRGQPVFLFVTAGFSTGGTFDWARDLLTRLGYVVLHEARYYVGRDLLLAAIGLRALPGELLRRFGWLAIDVREAAVEILAGTERHVYTGDLERVVLSSLLWRGYLTGCRRARLFRVDTRCNQCGLCVSLCPTGNVRLEGSAVAFGVACTLCLRCLNVCPCGALQVAHVSQSAPRYLAPGFQPALASRAEG